MELFIPFDYSTLRIIWWVLLGLLLVGFSVMDGFDLGIAILLLLVAKKDQERRIVINVIGPFWEGNQVWLITAAGAVFAAWPILYATLFSTFYVGMIVLLLGLIIRPVGFKYRSKVRSIHWRFTWDKLLCLSGLFSILIFGLAIGNLIVGIPFKFDVETIYPLYEGNFYKLLNPFALFTGITSISVFTMHGSTLLAWKTDGLIAERACNFAKNLAILTTILFVIWGLWISILNGYIITSEIDFNSPSNPCVKIVEIRKGAWLLNYANYPILWFIPFCCINANFFVLFFSSKRYSGLAFLSSSLSIIFSLSSIGAAIFPFLLPSSLNEGSHSLTLWDASSSYLTLWIMFLATLFFLPIVIAYTTWAYQVMRGTVTQSSLDKNPNSY